VDEAGPGLHADVHYPRSTGEFQSWFATDADCLDWLWWPGGFACPECGHAGGWAVADGRYKCAACGKRTSVMAGTLFDRRRTPLTVWFTACWMFATAKDGISALSLQRALEIGSYATAWAMLHRLRSVLVRPGRDRLAGRVEVDETYLGGEEPGLRGGRARTGIAVEVKEPKGMPRWPSAGCWAPTRARSMRPTCRVTWTSSASASTGADPAAEGWSSTACSNSPSATIRCATGTWPPPRSPRRSNPRRRASGAIHRASNARGRPGPGEPLTWDSPVR
jgi:hypothetical protein